MRLDSLNALVSFYRPLKDVKITAVGLVPKSLKCRY